MYKTCSNQHEVVELYTLNGMRIQTLMVSICSDNQSEQIYMYHK